MRKFFLMAAVVIAMAASAQVRQEISLCGEWLFSHDKQEWQTVRVPHDWAISGPFDKKWDLQVVAIEQNGEKIPTEKSGRSGSLPWIGDGHYKRTFSVPSGYGHALLKIDGAMAEPTVFINGHKAGYWAYGYNAFNLDITPYINMGGENLIEVDLKNVEESSRWYPGAGIYRPVSLILSPKAHIKEWGTYARTLTADDKWAHVSVDAEVEGAGEGYALEVELLSKKGAFMAGSHCDVPANGRISTVLDVEKPQLWSPESPTLYRLHTKLMKGTAVVDEQFTNVGIRTISVTKEGGFQLNGVSRKIKGVCLHHDLGPLGAAVNKSALIRQIKIMKEMGADAIRTAHNMPSQWQMDICDSLGMMVMAESFDMWIYPKCKNGYARFFKEWSERDITNLVLANRNHPSIIMWSIGNEIPEQWDKNVGVSNARRLQDLCHSLDPSRPVTQGMDRVDNAVKSGFAQVMDVPGYNYRLHKYESTIGKLPQGYLLGSETASTVSSRGVYYLPVEPKAQVVHPDGQCSGYDVEWCSWSNLPDDDWQKQEDLAYVIGEFVWTGFDYLGEPTPYDEYWPSRSSYFGICDLAGLPKDRYYLYRSHWNKQKHTVHLLPHWNWESKGVKEKKSKMKSGRRLVVPVYCYTDGVEGELFVNGKSQGRVRKNKSERLDRFRLRWNNVVYEPGEIRVMVYDEKGAVIGEDVRKTAGEPSQIVLDADRNSCKADGEDLVFVTVSLADRDGVFVPDADDQLTFTVEGNGTFEAVCNGDATSLEVFTEPTMKLFSGQLVVILRPSANAGSMTLTVSDAKHRLSKSLTIKTK